MKRRFPAFLAMLLILTLVFSASFAEVTYPIETKNNKLTFWCPIQPIASKHMTSYNEHLIYGKISENTGMDVEFQNCSPGDGATQLNLIVAGGDLPDIIQIRGMYPGGASAGVSEGVFADLTPYLEKYAPDYWAAMRSSDLCYRLCTDENGHVFAFYCLKPTGPAFYRMNCLQEVMDEYQFALPETLADYEAIFAKLAEEGKTGLYIGTNGREKILMWPYGITDDWMLDENGRVAFGMYTPAYKEYLTMMNDWYSKGYIYKDFMSTISDPERFALLSNRVVFMLPNSVDVINSNVGATGQNSLPLPYVRKEKGQALHFESTYTDLLPENGFGTTVISAQCKNIEEAVMYMNYYYTKEGADLCNWGIKDYTYTEDENGVKTYTDGMLNNPDIPLSDAQMNLKLHMTAKLSEADVVCNPNVIANAVALEKRMLYSDDTTVDHAQNLPAFPFNAEASEKRSTIMSEINTYIDEMTLKFITGIVSLDEFDNYMAQLKAMGIEDAIEITQSQYDAFINKPGL